MLSGLKWVEYHWSNNNVYREHHDRPVRASASHLEKRIKTRALDWLTLT